MWTYFLIRKHGITKEEEKFANILRFLGNVCVCIVALLLSWVLLHFVF